MVPALPDTADCKSVHYFKNLAISSFSCGQQVRMTTLRILAIPEVKNSKNQQLQDILFNNSANTSSFTNLYDPFFDQRSIDAKSAVTFKKCHLVEELKFKIRRSAFFPHFQFQPSQQRSLFKCHWTFGIYGPLVKKASSRFLKDGLLTKSF